MKKVTVIFLLFAFAVTTVGAAAATSTAAAALYDCSVAIITGAQCSASLSTSLWSDIYHWDAATTTEDRSGRDNVRDARALIVINPLFPYLIGNYIFI